MTRVQQSSTRGPRWRRVWLNSLAWSVLVWSGTGLHTAAAQDQGTPGDEKRTEWFRHDKFGMFIPWGIYAVPAGEWMKVNGDSIYIYGTTASPFAKTPWGRCTAQSGKLYLHVFDWPTNGRLEVSGLKNKVKKAYLLADEKRAKLPVERQSNGKIVIKVPSKAPDSVNTVIVLQINNK